jgi:hypothetical protein
MTDSAGHDRQTVAFPMSDLTRRLLRRATEPVGAIDVRHAVELHSRSSFGSAQRLELLEGLKRRYGLGQSGDAAGHALPVAGGPFTAALQRTAASPFDFAAVSSSPGRARIAETAMAVISGEPPAPSAQHYRVKRQNRYAEPNPVAPLSSETVTTRSAAAGGIGERPNSVAATRLLRKTDDTQPPAGSGPQASPLSPARAADSQPVDQAAPRQEGPPAAGLPQVGELSRAAVAAPLLLQRVPDGSAETGQFIMRDDLTGSDPSAPRREHLSATALPQVGELSRAAVAAPLLLQRMPDGSAETGQPIMRDDLAGGDPSAPRREHLSATALPQVGELSRAAVAAPMPLQRMPDGPAETGQPIMRDDLAGSDPSAPRREHLSAAALPQVGELSRAAVAAPLLLQRMPDGSAETGHSIMRGDLAGNDPSAPRREHLSAAGLPQVGELPRAAVAAPLLLQRMPDGSAETGHSIMRGDLAGSDQSALRREHLPPAGGGIRLSTDSIAATQLQRATGDTQSSAGSGPEASALPSVRAADTRPVEEPAPRDGGSPAAGLPQVSELSRAAVAAPMPLQRMPIGSAEIDHSILRDDLPHGDASPLSRPPPATQLQRTAGDTQSLAGSGPEAAALPLLRAAAADNPRRAGNQPAPANDGSPGAGAVPQVSELRRSAAVAQLLLQRMPDGSAAMSRSTPLDFSPNGDALPLSGASSAEPHSQRKAGDPPASPAESPMPAGAPPHINGHAQFGGAVSAEIRAATPPPGSAGIVWRKADANGASRASAAPAPAAAPTYSNGAQILRAPAAEADSGSGVTPAEIPSSESGEVDVFLIAEQVSRIIARQLRVERERRGLRR